jgi:hypothetical protein
MLQMADSQTMVRTPPERIVRSDHLLTIYNPRREFLSGVQEVMSEIPTTEADGSEIILEYTIKIARNGDVTNDTVTHGNSYAVIYRAFHAIKAEVDRQIAERRECPFNPIFKEVNHYANLKTSTRTYTADDVSEDELRDPEAVERARQLENANRRTRIETLDPKEAATLRKARKMMRIVRDRRLKQSAQP